MRWSKTQIREYREEFLEVLDVFTWAVDEVLARTHIPTKRKHNLLRLEAITAHLRLLIKRADRLFD